MLSLLLELTAYLTLHFSHQMSHTFSMLQFLWEPQNGISRGLYYYIRQKEICKRVYEFLLALFMLLLGVSTLNVREDGVKSDYLKNWRGLCCL